MENLWKKSDLRKTLYEHVIFAKSYKNLMKTQDEVMQNLR